MMEDSLHHSDDEPGFVIGWKYKCKFEAGCYDEEMSYGKARKRAEVLHDEHPDMTFWPQKKTASSAFYNPGSH